MHDLVTILYNYILYMIITFIYDYMWTIFLISASFIFRKKKNNVKITLWIIF